MLCYELNVLLDLYVEALTSSVVTYQRGDEASKEVTKTKWGQKGGALTTRIGAFIRCYKRRYQRTLPSAHTQERFPENPERL